MFDLSWITETLAIGGSFLPSQAPELARDHGVSAVVDLRGEACDDAQLLASHGIELLHLPTVDLRPVAPAMLDRGVRFVSAHLAAGRRVLVHCTYGIGRSVLLGLCVLVAHGHAPIDALTLAKERRACVSPSPAQYAAWAAWLATWQGERHPTWRVPSYEEFRAIAYRQLV
jgi:protein-tyrosine phosphatase